MKLNYTMPEIYPKSLDVSKTWFVAFRATNPDTGERKQFQFRAKLNLIKNKKERYRESKALCNVLLTMLQDDWNPFTNVKELERPTLSSALDNMLEIKRSTLKIKSYRGYSDTVRSFQKWLKSKHWSFMEVQDFHNRHAIEYADMLSVNRKYAGKTFNVHIGILKTMFNMFVEREDIDRNPFDRIKKQLCDRGRNFAFSDYEKKALIDLIKVKDEGLYRFIMFMYHTFIRRTELTKIRVGDVSIGNKSIIINADIAKNRRQQSVVIPKGLIPIVECMELDKYPSDYFLFGHGLKPNSTGYKKPDTITEKHRKYLKTLKINSDKTLYSWKHTGVCDYYNALKDPYVVMRQLRHHDMSITMIYLKSLGLMPNEAFININLSL